MFDPERKNERPISHEKLMAILWLIALNGDKRTAAARAGVGVKTLDGWMKNDQDFQERYREEWGKHLGVGSRERQTMNSEIPHG